MSGAIERARTVSLTGRADAAAVRRDLRTARWVAAVAGLIGFVCAVLTPLLPVTQTVATLDWPGAQGGRLGNVTAPLISQAPLRLTATLPCDVFSRLPADGGLAVGTAPADGKQAALNAMLVTATDSRVDVVVRNVVIVTAPRAQVASPACERLEITSTHDGTFGAFVGLRDADGDPLRGGFADPNLRPAVVGVFTDLTGPAPPGLDLSAEIDTRFSTSPTPLKLTAMLLAITATVVALLALWRLDRVDGRRMRRALPSRWRTVMPADAAVIGGFVVWHVIGAGSSDDGYQMAMARVAGPAGYMSNYFRWFGSPEDPFGWYYNVLAAASRISETSMWMRLPDLLCGVLCWLLLSREVLPRLGRAVAGSRAAVWSAGLVLLAAWMPFNNGLRPEGQIATGALITYVLVERAMVSGRLTPAALGIVVASFILGIQPTGIIAVAALLAGGRPILRIFVRRRRIVGTAPVLFPLLAAGTVILAVVFADQTFATVLEATRVRTSIGPAQEWYTENLRYYYLILPTVDGSLSRRFGFAVTFVAMVVSLLVMLRRGRVPGVCRGPVWRLVGVIAGTMFFLIFAPTKWVHHLGLFAAVGAAMAAVATVLVSPAVLRSARNRMAMLSVVLFLLAMCFATTNGWWYVSSFGVPFNNTTPRLGGVTVATVFFALFTVALVATVVLHVRGRGGDGRVVRTLTTAPITVAAALMVAVFVGSMSVAVVRQFPTYTNGWSNIRSLAGGCGLADDVLVEPDANVGFLAPLPERGAGPLGPLGPLGGVGAVGFAADAVPERIVAESIRQPNPLPGTDADWDAPPRLATAGVNGSRVPLPYGLDPARVPVAGSYRDGPQQQATLTSAWYRLPAADAAHPLVVVTAAGTIAGRNVADGTVSGQTVDLEYAVAGPDGAPVAAGRVSPYDLGPTPSWRNLRFPRAAIPADAVAVRVVAVDASLNQGDWVAVTPPRVPELRSLQEYVGSRQPVLMDWAVGLVFPCQQPMLHNVGVTEVPTFRITPDYPAKRDSTDTWQDGRNGGLLGITDVLLRASVMATYLSQDWGRDWGSLRRFTPVVDADTATLDLTTQTRSGLWSPGPMRIEA